MKVLFGFVLGVVLAVAAMSYAQGWGTATDQYGGTHQFYQFPNGQTQYFGPNGQSGSFYQMPQSNFGRNPC